MRVALCFYGFFRLFENTYNSYVKNIVNVLDTDIFICSPNIKDENDNKIISNEFVENIFKEKLIKYKLFDYNSDIYKNLVSKYNLPEREYFLDWVGQSYRIFSMFHQIKQVLELKEQYERDNNFIYDAVILTRPDLDIIEPINFVGFDLNKIYFCGPPATPHIAPIIGSQQCINDHLLLSNSSNMSKIKYVYDLIPEFSKNGIIINNETVLGYLLIRYNIAITNKQFTRYNFVSVRK
jgi:hypothetical protein